MKGKERRRKRLWMREAETRATPTTMPSMSFSSQEVAGLQTDLNHLPSKPRVLSVRDFHSAYLDCGLWPDLSPHSQTSLRAKYLQLQQAHHSLSLENAMLRQSSLTPPPCSNCQAFQATKQALASSLALSSFLLQEVLRRQPC